MHAQQISVVIPTMDRPIELADTITILMKQTVLPGEILVIDQSRTCDLLEQLRSRLGKFPSGLDFRYIRCSGKGLAIARNLGVVEATRDWMVFLDDDIFFDTHLIEGYLRAIEEESHVAMIGGRTKHPGKGETSYDKTLLKGIRASLLFPLNYTRERVRGIPRMTGGNFAVKREVAVAVGGFDENYVSPSRYGDTDFGLRVFLSGYYCVYDPSPWVQDRRALHGGQRSFPVREVRDKGMFSTCYFANRYFALWSLDYWWFVWTRLFRMYAFNRDSLKNPVTFLTHFAECSLTLLGQSRCVARRGPLLPLSDSKALNPIASNV